MRISDWSSDVCSSDLEQGDVILEFNGREVSEMRRLPAMVAETSVGSTVDVTLWRRDGEKKVRVTVGELEEEQLAATAPSETPPEASPSDMESMGPALGPITPALDRKTVVSGKIASVSVGHGGRRTTKQKT